MTSHKKSENESPSSIIIVLAFAVGLLIGLAIGVQLHKIDNNSECLVSPEQEVEQAIKEMTGGKL